MVCRDWFAAVPVCGPSICVRDLENDELSVEQEYVVNRQSRDRRDPIDDMLLKMEEAESHPYVVESQPDDCLVTQLPSFKPVVMPNSSLNCINKGISFSIVPETQGSIDNYSDARLTSQGLSFTAIVDDEEEFHQDCLDEGTNNFSETSKNPERCRESNKECLSINRELFGESSKDEVERKLYEREIEQLRHRLRTVEQDNARLHRDKWTVEQENIRLHREKQEPSKSSEGNDGHASVKGHSLAARFDSSGLGLSQDPNRSESGICDAIHPSRSPSLLSLGSPAESALHRIPSPEHPQSSGAEPVSPALMSGACQEDLASSRAGRNNEQSYPSRVNDNQPNFTDSSKPSLRERRGFAVEKLKRNDISNGSGSNMGKLSHKDAFNSLEQRRAFYVDSFDTRCSNASMYDFSPKLSDLHRRLDWSHRSHGAVRDLGISSPSFSQSANRFREDSFSSLDSGYFGEQASPSVHQRADWSPLFSPHLPSSKDKDREKLWRTTCLDCMMVAGDVLSVTSISQITPGGMFGHVLLVASGPQCIKKRSRESLPYAHMWPRGGVREIYQVPVIESARALEGIEESLLLLYVDNKSGKILVFGEVSEKGVMSVAEVDPPEEVELWQCPEELRNPNYREAKDAVIAEMKQNEANWSWATAVRALVLSPRVGRARSKEATRSEHLQQVQNCWQGDPICTSVPIIFWQKLLCQLGETSGALLEQPLSTMTAYDMVLKYMPLMADRVLPAELFKVMLSTGWTNIQRMRRPSQNKHAASPQPRRNSLG